MTMRLECDFFTFHYFFGKFRGIMYADESYKIKRQERQSL